jgi:sterol desaturase/sphingolipid hydroxylase (fatty acid hydroxylase superfamily)
MIGYIPVPMVTALTVKVSKSGKTKDAYIELNRTELKQIAMSLYQVRIYPNSKSPRIFKNRFLELLTKTHPLVITILYLSLGIIMLWWYLQLHPKTSAISMLSIVLSGFFSWTLAEYLMHRFLYHKAGDASYNSRFKYLFHGIHHEYPNDHERLVLPPVPSLLIAAILLGFFYLFMGSWTLVFGTGFLWGYLSYMSVHFIVHRYSPSKRFPFWWNYHMIHHFQQHDRAFGVTTPLWDFVFRTLPEPQRRTVELEIVKKN